MNLTTQFYTMIAMIGMGSYFGAALETYSRFFRRKRKRRWTVAINDVLFWIVQVLLLFYVLYIVNFGEIRFYIFLALLCGYAFYQSLLKNLYIRFLDLAVNFFMKLYRLIVRLGTLLIYKPVRGLVLFIISTCILLIRILSKILKGLLSFLWSLLKIILYPIFLIVKNLWKLLPPSFTIKVQDFFASTLRTIKRLLNFFKKTDE